MHTDSVCLLLNGRPTRIDACPPTTTLLNWLRTMQGLHGTKEGCAEGDCGACTVVIGSLEGAGKQLVLHSVNACIQFVAALDGKAVFTVEYLRAQAGGGLHPAQQAMVDCHGSQCGFCTPGFVMSLWAHYHQPRADLARTDNDLERARLRDTLSGNLCRCTGYRPILAAGERMHTLPPLELDYDAIRQALLTLERHRSLDFQVGENRFVAPRTLVELLSLKAAHPDATLLAGCTDIGLWVNKQLRELPMLIHLGQLVELQMLEVRDHQLVIGAAVTLERAYAALVMHYPALESLWKRFASLPIRNVGTLGGNLANGSPIGDSMPVLIALDAQIVLASVRGERRLPLDAFYLDYMKKDLAADEVLTSIEIPLPVAHRMVRSYKVAKRHDSDISAVCGGFALDIVDGVIQQARLAFGGMAATVRRARAAEGVLEGRTWCEASLADATAALAHDYTPLSDMRASAAYRHQVAANLLRRFYLETRADRPLASAQTSVFALTGAES